MASKDYSTLAKSILKLVGGEENITHMEHCSTRLRFSIADLSKVDQEGLKATPGVMGVIASGNQCQVVIGNDVIEVYDELMKLGKFEGGGENAVKAEKKDIGAMVLDMVVGIFQPLVPAIAGAGIMKALLTVFTMFGIMSTTGAVYQILCAVADATLYFLPIMVAYTTATKLNVNKLVAVSIVAAMMYSSTIALLAAEEGTFLFGIQLQNVDYSGQVFPAILTVAFMVPIERGFNKITPKAIRIFFVPMMCFAIVFPISLLFLGPLGYNIGRLLTTAILALYNTLGWVAVALVAAILPFMVSMGMHKALVPYAVSSIASPGFDMLYLPASLAHNISEGGACLAVALKTKDEDLRSTAISAGVSALFGITEPAIYGVTLQHSRVMMSVCASGFIGGLFIGLMKVKSFAAAGPGIASMPMFIDPDNSMNFIYAVIGFIISIVCSFVFALILYKDENVAVPDQSQARAPELTSGDVEIVSPLEGELIDITEVNDAVFAGGILGDGMAVIPVKGELYAPIDGEIELVADTKHSIGMRGDDGTEIMMHVGLDTVKLEGKYYEPQVKVGDKVKAGQLLLKFDIKAIKKEGYDVVTPIIILSAGNNKLVKGEKGTVEAGSVIMGLSKEG